MRLAWIVTALLAVFLPLRSASGQDSTDAWQTQRESMVEEILINAGIKNERVLAAMRATPRHLFVPRHLRAQAYYDMALPIGEQQTISSPFIVAYMTECLDPQPSDRVLEIGTGSGYQAAVLSSLVAHVYTIEIVEPLGQKASRTLKQAHFDHVSVRIGDGFQGWPEHAPFDKIIVTCSPERVPQSLIDQLKDGGRMVIPVGERYQQTMYLFRKAQGKLLQESLRPTLFVPMTGQAEETRVVQPDPIHPSIVNGQFELEPDANGFVSGWYYQRQAEIVAAPDSPQGKRYLVFKNTTPGRDSHLLQGLPLDGRRVHSIVVSGAVKTTNVVFSGPGQEGPRLVVTFYDKDRRELGYRWLGPWQGDNEWQRYDKQMPVPGATREIILRVGLFGATGEAAFDDIQLQPQH